MKRSSLTNAQREVLEELLADKGPIVATKDIFNKLEFETTESKHRFVSQLQQAGWLVRIKNGLYQIADLGSLGTLSLSRYTIAQLLLPESYVSFHAGLQFHGFFDQALNSISSVGLRQRPAVHLEGTTYRFVKTKTEYYYGFKSHTMNGRRVQIAEAEKAIIDLMQFARNGATVGLAVEILRDSHHRLQIEQLVDWALRSPLTVQRVIGFLLDTSGLAASGLKKTAQQSKSITKLTPESSQYSSTWRLYYDPFFAADMVQG
jgi:predicted transcriptional regulator of viral defense system